MSATSQAYAIGIDVGGTFTDVVVSRPDGVMVTAKAATTPADQSEGVLAGIALAAERCGLTLAALLAQTDRIIHGTTVATNALLERKTARVGLLTTAGHRDVIEMREGLKPERYNLRMAPPEPLVPRRLRLGVVERIRADGSVATPLDAASLDAAIAALAEAQVAAVAICFLHAWRNPAHERAAAAAVRTRLPNAYVTLSSDVLPEIKEYERFTTTVANAAVGPIIGAYLGRLQGKLAEVGFFGKLFVMLSHGGVASPEEATRLAAGTALSGPAGGVAAAVAMTEAGADLITFDMGGTSTDIALVRGKKPILTAGRTVGDARIALPSLDIATLGAGGGSIAELDRSGLLQVGPRSAGADPGPACYGAGGSHATVTDANLLLGYLDPAFFLGGQRMLDTAASERVLARLGEQLGLTPVEAAAGVHRLVNARMADGVRIATVRRGVDPRAFALLAFGGAAGLHVSAVAAALGIGRAIVPLRAAVLSAWGMLNTDLRIELMQSVMASLADADPAALGATFAAMEQVGRERLGWFTGEVASARAADMRYGEQVFEIPVPLDGLDWGTPALARDAAQAFHAAHQALYTYAMPEQEVVLVNARVSVTGRLPPAAAQPTPASSGSSEKDHRRAFFGDWIDVPVHDFARLDPARALAGPAIVESADTTVLLRAGDVAHFSADGWLAIEIGAR